MSTKPHRFGSIAKDIMENPRIKHKKANLGSITGHIRVV
jgi:hypothetical protein